MTAKTIFPEIPSDWRVVTLGYLAESSGGGIQTGPFGSQLHADDYVCDGVPSIMPKNISIDTVLEDDIARVSLEDVDRLAKYKVQTGDIVYSRRGDVEKCARITPKEDGWLCGTGCLRVRVLPHEVSAEYLHAYLCHPLVREWIVRHAVGATMPNLNTSILSALPVVVPNKAEMEAVSSIWLAISEKIQLNHQINQTLEQMAQAIFKSWFVDFEPVKAKMSVLEAGGSEEDALLAAMRVISGKSDDKLERLKTERPEQYAELAATAELFPTAMKESEPGEIPEGWKVASFSDLAKLNTRSVKPSDDPEKIWEHFSIPAFDECKAPSMELGGSIRSNKYRVDYNAVLVSKLNPHFPRVWWPEPTDHEAAICSTEFMQFVSKSSELRPFVAAMVASQPFQQGIRSRVTGSTGSRQRAQPRQVAIMDVVMPPEALALEYSRRTAWVYAAQARNIKQSQTLAELRDTLLPKLLSGELTIPQAEEQVTEVADA